MKRYLVWSMVALFIAGFTGCQPASDDGAAEEGTQNTAPAQTEMGDEGTVGKSSEGSAAKE